MAIEIHPKQIQGPWDEGYALDVHTISSTLIGQNEFGHPEFDTVRSPLGELVYRLKYGRDRTVIPAIAGVVVEFVQTRSAKIDVVVPMPPSKAQRPFQPVSELCKAIAENLGVPFDEASLRKVKATPQMKDVGDYSARLAALQEAFAGDRGIEGRSVLLIDDLYQSGASMNAAARTLKTQSLVKAVFAVALTRTRN